MVMEFVGAGIAFPMRIAPSGGVALVTREREIEEAIRLILGTSPGERPMRPEFGSRIAEHVFGPANASTASTASSGTCSGSTCWPMLSRRGCRRAPTLSSSRPVPSARVWLRSD